VSGESAKAKEEAGGFGNDYELADSNLTPLEASNLAALCSYGLTIGSGYGLCPCTLEDYDF